MSQEKILKLIEKKGMMTLQSIKEEIKTGNISDGLAQLEKYGEIKSFIYNSKWKIYCLKEVFDELDGIHKIGDNPGRQRAENDIKISHNRRNDSILI